MAGSPSGSKGFCPVQGVVVIRKGHAANEDVICSIP
jgi:hypothetical protein